MIKDQIKDIDSLKGVLYLVKSDEINVKSSGFVLPGSILKYESKNKSNTPDWSSDKPLNKI